LRFQQLDPTISDYQPTALEAERKYLAVCARITWHQSNGDPFL
jgi:hypothetical protein